MARAGLTLSHTVAVAMVKGLVAELTLLSTLDADDRMTHTHRLDAVRAHLLERAGIPSRQGGSGCGPRRTTASVPGQRYLTLRAQLGWTRRQVPPSSPWACRPATNVRRRACGWAVRAASAQG
jgi:hypothetical protein